MKHRLALVLICLGGAALFQVVSSARQPALPASLSDKEFWDLVVTLSEPDGFFEDENYVSNELGYQRTMARLQQSVPAGGVLLGVGPEQNFHYVAALDPALTFVIDIRRQNAIEHLMYKALFELAADRAEFVSMLFSRPRPAGLAAGVSVDALFQAFATVAADEALFRRTLTAVGQTLIARHAWPLDAADRASLAKIVTAFRNAGPDLMYVFRGTAEAHPTYRQMMTAKDDAGRNWSYLESDAAFERVRLKQRRNLIVPVVGDFAGPKALKAIGAYLRERGARVSLFYVSNVEPYLFTAGRSTAFYDSLLALPFADEALFVRAFFGSTTRECRAQRPTLRTPVVGSVRPVLEAYRSGTLTTQCALVGLSR
jgi:hypothetical protein